MRSLLRNLALALGLVIAGYVLGRLEKSASTTSTDAGPSKSPAASKASYPGARVPDPGGKEARPADVTTQAWAPSTFAGSRVYVSDGDTLRVHHGQGLTETVRLLGIDAPEIAHASDSTSVDQPYGRASKEFAKQTFDSARVVELRRVPWTDRYGRSLAYAFVDGRNYAAMAVEHGLATENISRFGDNRHPDVAAEILDAARRAGPVPFQPPERFRARPGGGARPPDDNAP